MTSVGDWMDTFELAGVAAFWCRRDGEELRIRSRTSHFVAAVTRADAVVDEVTLLDRLATARPSAGAGEVMMIRDPGDGWHCVVQPMTDPDDCVAILRQPSPCQLRNEEFFAVLEAIPDVIARFDRSLRYLYVNPAVETMDPDRPVHVRIGRDHTEVGVPSGLADLWQEAYRAIFEDGTRQDREFEFPTPDGPRHFVLRLVPEFDPDGRVRTVLSSARDVTELKALQRELEVLAQTDPLTGLLNRRAFVERATIELEHVRRGNARLAVLMLDVDDLKFANDTHGHPAGDRILAALGEIVLDEIGPHDFAARLGGDEFCVGLVGVEEAEADGLVDRIRRRIDAEFPRDESALQVRVSIGATVVTASDGDMGDVMRRVDQLMYGEKQRKRRRIGDAARKSR